MIFFPVQKLLAIFFFFFCHNHSMQKFLGQRPNPMLTAETLVTAVIMPDP